MMQLAAAKRALGEDYVGDDLTALQVWLKLSPIRAKIVLRLYRAKGRYVPYWLLADELSSEDALPSTVKVHAHQIRKILGEDALENAEGVGYRLSPAAILRVRDAITAGA